MNSCQVENIEKEIEIDTKVTRREDLDHPPEEGRKVNLGQDQENGTLGLGPDQNIPDIHNPDHQAEVKIGDQNGRGGKDQDQMICLGRISISPFLIQTVETSHPPHHPHHHRDMRPIQIMNLEN